jgi:holo-[acyl-carrier protein] synthase
MKIGIDIVEVQRLENNEKIWKKLLTERELDYVKSYKDPATHVAGFFAAKEAFSKALGTGFRGFSLKDIEVFHDDTKRPFLRISEKIVNAYNVSQSDIQLSISHEKHYAVAAVLIEDN